MNKGRKDGYGKRKDRKKGAENSASDNRKLAIDGVSRYDVATLDILLHIESIFTLLQMKRRQNSLQGRGREFQHRSSKENITVNQNGFGCHQRDNICARLGFIHDAGAVFA